MKTILMLVIILFSLSSKAEEVDLFDLWDVPLLAPSDCMDYCIEGTCTWLKCSLSGCKTHVSLRVRHRVPDLVVSSYSEVGENPWKEFKAIYGSTQKTLANEVVSWIGSDADVGGGESVNTTEEVTKNEIASTVFREVDVVGNWFDFSQVAGDIYCGTNTTPFIPHYSSAVDGYLWRTGLTDILDTLKIFTEVIGIPYVKEWGSVYWRTGFIKQMNPAKTNAVLAFRAAHIATRTNQGRIYNSATGNPNSGHKYYEIPKAIEVDGSDGSVWQMVSPKKDNTCYVFDDIAESENIANVAVGGIEEPVLVEPEYVDPPSCNEENWQYSSPRWIQRYNEICTADTIQAQADFIAAKAAALEAYNLELLEFEKMQIKNNWANERWENNNSDAVFKLWRRYECCKDRGTYLFTIKFSLCI